jgi:hypothetical protein
MRRLRLPGRWNRRSLIALSWRRDAGETMLDKAATALFAFLLALAVGFAVLFPV